MIYYNILYPLLYVDYFRAVVVREKCYDFDYVCLAWLSLDKGA